ncbi:4-(cytidine 5'-diphospho)-2-C-methyl-D-erythritol kinase [Candidatus Dependentiae bacterium]|nr:4-(cytidine 5'-diphospho)-2-C-methyl-D-erythritol kinase [Candidatus Dependentiae bacterium]
MAKNNSITVKAPAKLNIILQITGKRDDGYHILNSLMQSISLYDTITIKKLSGENKKISISAIYSEELKRFISEDFSVPSDPEKNISGKVARKILDKFNIKNNIKITIKKSIPIGAGLGGGSSDGAGTAIALNRLFNLNMSDSILRNLTKNIGADIPFNISPGSAIVKGIGDKVKILKKDIMKNYSFIIIYPKIHSSTIKVYKNHKFRLTTKKDYVKIILNFIKKGADINLIEKYIINDLEQSAFRLYSGLKKVKHRINKLTNKKVFMSGSGSALFLLFDNDSDKEKCFKILKMCLTECIIKKCVPV